MARALAAWLSAVFLILSTPGARARASPSELHQLTFDGRQRSYLVHRPPWSSRRGPALPLVLALHGGGGSAARMEDSYGLDAYADRYGMIVVYPEGIPSRIGRFHTWNAGRCCGPAQREDVDDVGFLSAVIDAVVRGERADPRRVFVTGHSNGAQMAYRLACEIPDKIAAIAPVSGQDATLRCPGGRPVPVLHIHGTLDHCALYEGGPACGGCFAKALELPQIDAAWPWGGGSGSAGGRAESYGCSARTMITARHGPVVCEAWQGCPAGASVTLCRIEGGGHAWQGSSPPLFCRRRPDGGLCRRWTAAVGPAISGVDTDELIFDFFRLRAALPTGPQNH